VAADLLESVKQRIPPTAEIKARIDQLFDERRFLRELLKLAEKRDAVDRTTTGAAAR
jgi:hypothetical protein